MWNPDEAAAALLCPHPSESRLIAPHLTMVLPNPSVLSPCSVTHLQAHYPFPDSLPKLMAVYAYLLSHPGIPCVFWQHVYGKKNGAGIVNGEEERGGVG